MQKILTFFPGSWPLDPGPYEGYNSNNMNAEIISIGTELLLGHILNTNTAFLSQKLAETGIDIYNTSVVGDNPQRLTASLKQALGRADIVITTGGLGPTVDDITAETVSKLAPERTKLVKNKVGSAPGLIAEVRGRTIICLPGPPRELEPMFINDIIPCLAKIPKKGRVIKSRTIKISGLPESLVNNKVKGLLQLKPPTTVGIYAKLGEVSLKIMSKADNEKAATRSIAAIEKKIRGRLKGFIFGCDEETLEDAVAKLLTRKKLTIAIAESCTGGLLSNRLTNVSGSSKYFIMGVVAYSNNSKESLLAVRRETLQKHGAVSKDVALAMAKGAMWLSCADIGIGITGIAGPTGGTRSKPVGLVYIAIMTDKKSVVREMRFKGSREEIKFRASQVALDLIRKNI